MTKLAWGSKIPVPAQNKVVAIAAKLKTDPSFLMACMAFETGRTFDPAQRNAAGSGAMGLIQIMPQTAVALGTSTQKLAVMTVVQQLDVVEKYLKPFTGRLKLLSDCYMAILWPAAVGKPDNGILFSMSDPKRPKLYMQNKGLDFNHDGHITKGEATAKVQAMLDEGFKAGNFSIC